MCPIQTLKTVSSRKAWRRDKLARWVITLGGVTVIASVVAIVALIVGVTVPLFRPPRAKMVCHARLPKTLSSNDILCCGIDLASPATMLPGSCGPRAASSSLVDLHTGEVRGRQQLSRRAKPARTAFGKWKLGAGKIFAVVARWRDVLGRDRRPAARLTRPAKSSGHPIQTLAVTPPVKGPPPRAAVLRRSEAGATTRVALLPDGTISILRQQTTQNLAGDEEVHSNESVLREDFAANIQVLAMDRDGNACMPARKTASWPTGN